MDDCLGGVHINLKPDSDDSVNVNIEGNKVKVVFRVGDTQLEKVFNAAEAVREGQRIAEAGVYHNEVSIEGVAVAEFGRHLKRCGEFCAHNS